MAKQDTKKKTPKCPECGGVARDDGGDCYTCTFCGYEFSTAKAN